MTAIPPPLPRGGRLRDLVPGPEDLQALHRLALPVVVVQVGISLMGVVDTIMVGRVSAVDLAAAALGNLYFFAVSVFGMGVLMALDPLIAQAVGAEDEISIARGVQRGIVLALGLTVAGSFLLLPAAPVLAMARQPGEVVPVAAGYALATIPGIFPFYLFVVFRQTLQSMGRMRPIVLTIVAANLANVAFNWVLIYGNLGFPALGAVGSGWASSLSRWVMAGLLLAMAWPLLSPYLRTLRRESLALLPLARMLRLGAPVGVQLQLEFGAFGMIGLVMGWMGTVALAGHQVALNLASFTFMVPLGISQAAAVLVGRGVGAGEPDRSRRAAGAGLLLGGGFMALTALAFVLAPGFWARVFTTEPEVIAVAVMLLPIAGLFQVVDGLQVVSAGILRGVGDTRGPMVLNLVGFWFLGIPVSLLLGFRMGLGPAGLWWGLALGLGVVAALLLLRVRSRMGRELARVMIDEGVDRVPRGRARPRATPTG